MAVWQKKQKKSVFYVEKYIPMFSMHACIYAQEGMSVHQKMSILDPVWVKPASITKKTQDPLGLDRVSNRLTSDTLTGITALTRRARYYSFYVWVIKNINEIGGISRIDQYENAFFDRERAHTMACLAHEQSGLNLKGDHSNIQGSLKGHTKWRESDTKLRLHGFRHLGNRLGGYGYYYQASIGNLGLTKQEQTRDVLTPLGVKLAKTFEKVISQTKYYKKFVGKDVVPKSVLEEYGSKCCICLLGRRDAPDREILRDIIFGTNVEAQGNRYHKSRQNTLALILYDVHVLSQQSKRISNETFLDIAYFRQFPLKGNPKGHSFPSHLNEMLERWKMFRSHDYFSYACESLLHVFLETLDIYRTTGLSFSKFIGLLDKPELLQELSSLLETKFHGKSLKEVLLSSVLLRMVYLVTRRKFHHFDSDVSLELDHSCDFTSKINERMLITNLQNTVGSEELNLSKLVALASLVLLLLHGRFYWRLNAKDKSWRWLIQRSESDLSILNLVLQLEQKLSNQTFTMFDFVKWVYKDYVLTQAINIYNQKVGSSLYSRPISWFHQDGKVYRLDRRYEPRFRNSRFHSCMTILNDLGFCKSVKNHLQLTKDGKALLCKLGIMVK